jgi:hypothetical protein
MKNKLKAIMGLFGMASKMLYVAGTNTESEFAEVF